MPAEARAHEAGAAFAWIAFDCYGTLIDWEEGMARALRRLAAAHGLSLDPDALPQRYIRIELALEQERYRPYRDVLVLGARRLLEEQGIALEPGWDRLFLESLPRWPPFPEVPRALRVLKARYRLAVLSNVDDDLIRHSLESLGVAFDAVITAEQVRSYKPAPGHWERLLAVAGVPRTSVLHVAASLVHDVAPAKALGFPVAWINRKGEGPGDSPRPDWIFPDLKSLAAFLAPES